ncbi:MAG: HEAT repeat domain-containing protein [Planctomycetes bacterium]|nr:HEAT repeat domain-containing protein [Planctomycetota bacterium]
MVFLALTGLGVGMVSMYALLTAVIDAFAAAMILVPAALAGLWLAPIGRMGEVPRRWNLLLGACLGFLPHNFRPASIFLGDAGSLLMGFTIIVIILTLGDTGRTQLVVAGLVINWVARMDSDPHDHIKALGRDNDARWQAAMNLANVLRSDGNLDFKRDPAQAQHLAALLDREITLAGKGDESIRMRMYLSRALGEFHVDDGLPVLIKAASTQRFEQELSVRWFAFAGISKLVERIGSEPGFDEEGALLEFLLKSLDDQEASIQWRAAFALGWYDDPRSISALAEALGSGRHANVRYNAAVALARRGDARCERVLREMLDPPSIEVGDECQDVRFFPPDSLPPLAFSHDTAILRAWRVGLPS